MKVILQIFVSKWVLIAEVECGFSDILWNHEIYFFLNFYWNTKIKSKNFFFSPPHKDLAMNISGRLALI